MMIRLWTEAVSVIAEMKYGDQIREDAWKTKLEVATPLLVFIRDML